MDEAEQDQYEARLKELFDSFDSTGTGSLGQEELTDLTHMLHLDEVAPALLQTLLQDNHSGRVHFEQFKEALILFLSTTFSNEKNYQERDASSEVKPKYVKDGKRYGRRSTPEFTEVTVIEPLSNEAQHENTISEDCGEHWQTSSKNGEEYEAEGQLGFWNPDDLNTPQGVFSLSQDWIEEKLQTVCEDLRITREGQLSRKELISVCEQYGLQTIDGQVLEDVFQKLDEDGMMNVSDFFYGVFRNGKPPTPSSSTPYRHLKRHLSFQPLDESGRRTATPSIMSNMIGLRLLSYLDDGTGYTSTEQILDSWHEEGIENSHEILKALDFGFEERISLAELTMALENELLITKNGIHQAILVCFKKEIKHLLEKVDQVIREKEKLRLDLEKAEKFKTQMASEVDDHHAAIERLNECNLRKLDQEYRDRITTLRNEFTKEKDQILQQATKQCVELEQEVEKGKAEESYLRDRLTLSLKESSRLEKELLENAEKLAEYESLVTNLQGNLENILKEKFGDLDPSSAEFFLHEERFAKMKKEHEQQCRTLQDQIDELQSELEEYRTQGRMLRFPMKSGASEDLESKGGAAESDQGIDSEECYPLNVSLETEMAIEQMKEQHYQEVEHLKLQLEEQARQYEIHLKEMKTLYENQKDEVKQKCLEEVSQKDACICDLQFCIVELQRKVETFECDQKRLELQFQEEKNELMNTFEGERARLVKEHAEVLKVKEKQAAEYFQRENDKLIQNYIQLEASIETKVDEMKRTFAEEMQELEKMYQNRICELKEKQTVEQKHFEKELVLRHQNDILEEREKMNNEYKQKIAEVEVQLSQEWQTILGKLKEERSHTETHYKQELQQLMDQHNEERSMLEFEKDELLQEAELLQERLVTTLNKFREDTLDTETRYKCELQDLLEQQSEERTQWEFEKEELLQEAEEIQEKLKEALEKEKKKFDFQLAEAKENIEKNYKEQLNSLTLDNERLQKDLESLRESYDKQKARLSGYQTDLHVKEDLLAKMEDQAKQANIRIDQEWEQIDKEREEMRSKILANEAKILEMSSAADTMLNEERPEVDMEITRLYNQVKELQEEKAKLSALQAVIERRTKENVDMTNTISHLQEVIKGFEKEKVTFENQQTLHQVAIAKNDSMSSEIIRLNCELQALKSNAAQQEEAHADTRNVSIAAQAEICLLAEDTEQGHIVEENPKPCLLSELQRKVKPKEAATDEIRKLQASFVKTEKENQCLCTCLSEIHEQIAELGEMCGIYDEFSSVKDAAKYKNILKGIANRFLEKTDNLEKLKAKLLACEANMSEMSIVTEGINKEKDEMKLEISSLQKQITDLKTGKLKLESMLHQLTEEKEDFERKVGLLQGSIKDLEAEKEMLSDLQSLYQQVVEEKDDLSSELSGLKQQMQDLLHSKERKREANGNTKNEITIKTSETASLEENDGTTSENAEVNPMTSGGMSNTCPLISELQRRMREFEVALEDLPRLQESFRKAEGDNYSLSICLSRLQENLVDLARVPGLHFDFSSVNDPCEYDSYVEIVKNIFLDQNEKLNDMKAKLLAYGTKTLEISVANTAVDKERVEISSLQKCITELERENLTLHELQSMLEEAKGKNKDLESKIFQLQEERRRLEEVTLPNTGLLNLQVVEENKMRTSKLLRPLQQTQELSHNTAQTHTEQVQENVLVGVNSTLLDEGTEHKQEQSEAPEEELGHHEASDKKQTTYSIFELQKKIRELEAALRKLPKLQEAHNNAEQENHNLRAHLIRLQEKITDLKRHPQVHCDASFSSGLTWEEKLQMENDRLIDQCQALRADAQEKLYFKTKYEQCKKENIELNNEITKLHDKVEKLEGSVQEFIQQYQSEPVSTIEVGNAQKTEVEDSIAVLKNLQQECDRCDKVAAEVKTENKKLQKLNYELKKQLLSVSNQQDQFIELEKKNHELVLTVHNLQEKCILLQKKIGLQRCEVEKLAAENAALKQEITILKEENCSFQKLQQLNWTQEEMQQKVKMAKKENVTAQRMLEKLQKQVTDLKAKNLQLEDENIQLCQKNSKNKSDVRDLSIRLAELLKQTEKKEMDKHQKNEAWEQERQRLMQEQEKSNAKSSAMLSSMEAELSKMKRVNHLLEKDNAVLKQELEDVEQQLARYTSLESERAEAISKTEKLLREKETLSEELNRYVDKVARVSILETQLASVKQEKKSVEQQLHKSAARCTILQEKLQSSEESLQNTNISVARLKSDLRVACQENEALRQEVMALHKQLQNANEKNKVLEMTINSPGFQNKQKGQYWDELSRLMQQEQQLLRQENDRLQKELRDTKGELTHTREKVRQLDALVISLKQQKHQSQSSMVKAVEQEKQSLKRECDKLQKELSVANKKLSQLNSFEQELDTFHIEKEKLRSQQLKLDGQLKEMRHFQPSSRPGLVRSQSHHLCEHQLQDQVCTMVPKEEFVQLQQRLQQAERRNQQLQEELENRVPEVNMQQDGPGQLLMSMEARMVDVEQKLRAVKALLQDKVNQLKEQLSRNVKAEERIKDLYVENSQLHKALEMTEQRHRVAEKKNYLLEEKISGLNRIVRDLKASSLPASPHLHHLRS
ncbi:ninein [Protopterus annectens]|uniref:ninein n=1 Tax=Protopterus annectens TaxID=7888 RepID=UPI001CFA5EDB|nr:ninein [Protopterus annectens]